jgi:predicted transposase YbfD/YdcC
MTEPRNLFDDIPDPRASNTSHRLGDLLLISLAAIMCGAVTASEFALFAEERWPFLQRYTSSRKPPSHDTFSRLFRLLEPKHLAEALTRFSKSFAAALGAPEKTAAGVIAIDGKALRRACEAGCRAWPPLMVSAFASAARLCLAARRPQTGAGEVEAALDVLDMIDITGQIITADALHCHNRMVEKITANGGDYVLALKKNRPAWVEKAEQAFAAAAPAGTVREVDTSHGRTVVRQAAVVACQTPLCAGHAAFARIVSQRDDQPEEVRYFLLSRVFSPRQTLALVRAHWLVENSLHWVLDVHLGEDAGRARKDHAPENIATLKRIARNMLQMADKPGVPISHRMRKCAWNTDYLFNALAHMR